jgi:hypothetical protein
MARSFPVLDTRKRSNRAAVKPPQIAPRLGPGAEHATMQTRLRMKPHRGAPQSPDEIEADEHEHYGQCDRYREDVAHHPLYAAGARLRGCLYYEFGHSG